MWGSFGPTPRKAPQRVPRENLRSKPRVARSASPRPVGLPPPAPMETSRARPVPVRPSASVPWVFDCGGRMPSIRPQPTKSKPPDSLRNRLVVDFQFPANRRTWFPPPVATAHRSRPPSSRRHGKSHSRGCTLRVATASLVSRRSAAAGRPLLEGHPAGPTFGMAFAVSRRNPPRQPPRSFRRCHEPPFQQRGPARYHPAANGSRRPAVQVRACAGLRPCGRSPEKPSCPEFPPEHRSRSRGTSTESPCCHGPSDHAPGQELAPPHGTATCVAAGGSFPGAAPAFPD